ncbi:MAG: phosphate starvation-inducible protein PhoH [Actinomycetota bacterium]|nr:phosphate starvation-inducible protein PhoH [Actinomycetota bacterium]
MRPAVALLDAGASAVPPKGHETWGAALEVLDVYDVGRVDLARYAAVVLQGMVDQEFLHAHRQVLSSFLDDGRVVVWSGQLFRPWLPGCGAFVPAEVRSFRDYTVRVVRHHPVFDGVDPADLTRRKGVAGFFARGYHPPPEGAEVVLALAGGQPIVYVDRATTAGTIFAHAGTGLLGWADPASTAARISPQLLAWARREGSER